MSGPLTRRYGKGVNTTMDDGAMVLGATGPVSHTSEGHDASEDGAGRGTPVIAHALDRQAGGPDDGSAQSNHIIPTFAATVSTLTSTKTGGYRLGAEESDQLAPGPSGVRRLTPIECERLMSWPVILEIQGGSYEHIRGAIQSCCEEADAAIGARRELQSLWEYAGEVGAASPGHHGSPGRGDRPVLEVPYGTSSAPGTAGGMHRVWCHLSTEAAQAVARLFAGVPEGVFAPIGEPSLGCFARVTGWTAIDGEDTPDSRRYAACGDGVVSNVAEWLARGILEESA